MILTDWLNERGYEIYDLKGHLNTGKYYLVTGETVRKTTHVCIYKDGKLYHDPHPSNVGLIIETHFEYIGKIMTDKQRLDKLDLLTKGYGLGWILRESFKGCGMRLHESSKDGAVKTVREAIDAFKE